MSQDVLETSQRIVHRSCMVFRTHPSSTRTIARLVRAFARRMLAADGGPTEQRTVRAGASSTVVTGTSWDVLASAHQCVQCDAACRAAAGLVVLNVVGARQRPNAGANQRGRTSVSSSAGNGGASNRLATCIRRSRRRLTPATGRATSRFTGSHRLRRDVR